jgi:hypothetical protein
MGRKLLWGFVGLLVIGLFIVLAMSLLGGRGTEVTPSESAIPSVSPSASSATKDLSSYFGSSTKTLKIPDDDTSLSAVWEALNGAAPAGGRAVAIGVTSDSIQSFRARNLLDLSGTLPPGLYTALAGDWILMSYGQQEVFDEAGTVFTDAPVTQRIIIVAEVSDASATNQLMTAWETSGLASADLLFGVSLERRGMPQFSSGSRMTIPLRYLNFPYADTSIDYGIVLASNGKNYLVITTSRESMYWVIDTLTK